ncbi:hypothetical protein [Anaerosporobacter faecicola]|uniref:hypothetical protein n=1 Tax=Anaerosporobacter faecicola TaxID=2718714 RepID=UPI00143A30F8|nr:hypothetical protein [Anaerosporobacter faecicola]
MNYIAEVINLSLKKDSFLKQFTILTIRKRFLGLLKIYSIAIPEEQLESTILSLQSNMSTKLHKEWYITIHTDKDAIILFRNRIFRMSTVGLYPIHYQMLDTSQAVDKDKWDEMIRYAKTLGVPDDQCDFLPENFETFNYH